MRLKTLFFPIMLVISISVFIGYVWPEIMVLRSVNEINLAKNKEVKDLSAKKEAIDLIGKQISDSESEKIIKNYLPEKKVEERIINDINYLANSSNISLVNISLSSGDDSIADNAKSGTSGLLGILNPLARADDDGFVVESNKKVDTGATLKAVSVNISILGEYEKIRVFIAGIHRLPIFNTIQSLNIGNEGGKQSVAEAESASNMLSADMVVDFGYAKVASVDGQKVLNFNSNIDKDVVEVLKTYTSEKNQVLESGSENKGRVNPFLAK